MLVPNMCVGGGGGGGGWCYLLHYASRKCLAYISFRHATTALRAIFPSMGSLIGGIADAVCKESSTCFFLFNKLCFEFFLIVEYGAVELFSSA